MKLIIKLASTAAATVLAFGATSASAQSTTSSTPATVCYSPSCATHTNTPTPTPTPTPAPAPQAQRRVLQFEAVGAAFGETTVTASGAGDVTNDETYAIKEGGIDFRADIAGQGCETDCTSLSYSGTLFETMRSGGLSSAMSTNNRPATSYVGNAQMVGLAARVVVDSAIGPVPIPAQSMPAEHQPR